MDAKVLFEKVLKDNEIIKGQLNNLQSSIQILKNNMIESQNNNNNINFSTLLDDINISSTKEEINQEEKVDNNIINKNNNKNNIIYNINEFNQENKNIVHTNFDKNNIYNKSIKNRKNDKDKKINNISNNFDNNIHQRNIKKLLKEKEVINQIYLLKENYNNYNNYNIYNKSIQETTSKKNKPKNIEYFQKLSESECKNKNNMKSNYKNSQKELNNNHNYIKQQTKIRIPFKKSNNIILNSAKKGKRTNSVLNLQIKTNKNMNKNYNNKNNNKLRYSYDDFYQRNENFEISNNNVNKRAEILNYLKQINSLQTIISQLKKENSILKNSLEKEKQKNKKYRKLTEEIISYFENPNNNL